MRGQEGAKEVGCVVAQAAQTSSVACEMPRSSSAGSTEPSTAAACTAEAREREPSVAIWRHRCSSGSEETPPHQVHDAINWPSKERSSGNAWRHQCSSAAFFAAITCSAGASEPSASRLMTDESARHAARAALRTDSLMSSTARMRRSCSSVMCAPTCQGAWPKRRALRRIRGSAGRDRAVEEREPTPQSRCAPRAARPSRCMTTLVRATRGR